MWRQWPPEPGPVSSPVSSPPGRPMGSRVPGWSSPPWKPGPGPGKACGGLSQKQQLSGATPALNPCSPRPTQPRALLHGALTAETAAGPTEA